jgi:hypothetical protein
MYSASTLFTVVQDVANLLFHEHLLIEYTLNNSSSIQRIVPTSNLIGSILVKIEPNPPDQYILYHQM